jgi:hypothetical protein
MPCAIRFHILVWRNRLVAGTCCPRRTSGARGILAGFTGRAGIMSRPGSGAIGRVGTKIRLYARDLGADAALSRYLLRLWRLPIRRKKSPGSGVPPRHFSSASWWALAWAERF